jgi:Fur family ferric uptake transcriptional regulator
MDINTQTLWLEKIRSSGYRITGPRTNIVKLLAESEAALSPMEIFLQIRETYQTLGLVSVYRTLEKLEDLGLVQRVHMQDGCHRFIAAANGHQHLVICKKCNRSLYFEGDDISLLITTVENRLGYQVESHWLQFFGICGECQVHNLPGE